MENQEDTIGLITNVKLKSATKSNQDQYSYKLLGMIIKKRTKKRGKNYPSSRKAENNRGNLLKERNQKFLQICGGNKEDVKTKL